MSKGGQAAPPSKEQIDEMSKAMKERFRQHKRDLDRQVMQIQNEEAMVKNEMKLAARKGDRECVRILATSLVQAQHGRRRLEQMSATLQAMSMSIQQALNQARLVGVMSALTPAMKQMADVMNSPEQRKMLMGFQKELTKMGMMEEMQQESLEDALGFDELSDAADAEVDRVMQDVIKGVAVSMAVPASKAAQPEVQVSAGAKAILAGK